MGGGVGDVYLPTTGDTHPLRVVFLKYEVFLEGIYFVNVSLPQQNLLEELGGSYEQQSDLYNPYFFLIYYIVIEKRKNFTCTSIL